MFVELFSRLGQARVILIMLVGLLLASGESDDKCGGVMSVPAVVMRYKTKC